MKKITYEYLRIDCAGGALLRLKLSQGMLNWHFESLKQICGTIKSPLQGYFFLYRKRIFLHSFDQESVFPIQYEYFLQAEF